MSVKHAMKRNEHYMLNRGSSELGLVADPVIEAIERLEFEDGLEAVVALRAAAPILGSIPNPPGGAGCSLG